jgi:LysR family hydrogen peroxide-inducible transcriptional activator
MTLTQLKYIVALDTHRSFSKAADYCNVSQPSLSTQVQKLEDELETIIFDRSTSPIIPTDIGERLVAQARNTLREMDEIKDIAINAQDDVSGQLRVGIIPSLAIYLIPLFLKEFIASYPKVTLIFSEGTRSLLFERLQREEIDIAIAPSPSYKHSFNEKNLFYEPFVAYISKHHRLYHKNKINIKDLCTDDILLLNQDHCMASQTDDLIDRLPESENPILFDSGNLETLKALVETDYSMTLLPFLAIPERKNEKNKLHVREFTKPEPTRNISIFYIRSFQKLNLINALFDQIRASVPDKLLKKENCVLTCLEELKETISEQIV